MKKSGHVLCSRCRLPMITETTSSASDAEICENCQWDSNVQTKPLPVLQENADRK